MFQNFKKLRNKFLKAILSLSDEGLTVREISAKTCIPKSTVAYHLKKYKQHNSIDCVSGSGRRNSLDSSEKALLIDKVLENPKVSAANLSNLILQKSGKRFMNRPFVILFIRKISMVELQGKYHIYHRKIWITD